MTKIRWDEHPEACQLASLGKKLSKAAEGRLQWKLFYYVNGRSVARTRRHFAISRQTLHRRKRRFDRHDLATLEARFHRTHNEEFCQAPAESDQLPPAEPPATTLGAHLQLRAASPGPRPPHPARIPSSLETKPRKGRASLIHWTSTSARKSRVDCL